MIDGTIDSGIEFDISSLLSVGDVTEVELEKASASILLTEPGSQYHELKSRVVEGSPRIDFRNAGMASRTQLRQNLERQQFLKMDEEEKQLQAQQRQQQQQSQTIAMPSVYHSTEVPPKVLQVKTELAHPTMYHIRQKQQQAVKSFLSDSDDHQIPAHSMPNLALPSTVDTQWISGSAPTELEADSFGTDLDSDFEMLHGIVLDTVDYNQDSDLHSITPSLTQMSSTLPQQQLFAQPLTLEVESAQATSSSSCPPIFPSQSTSPPTNMNDDEQKLWARDRQKKDNHNMIERRRRYNINDRIKELGTLLPKNYDQDMRVNKGSILKASVDYIKKLKKESDQLRAAREGNAQLEKCVQRLTLKLNQVSAVLKQSGMYNGLDEMMSMDMMVNPASVMGGVHPHTPPPSTSLTPTTTTTTTTMGAAAATTQLLSLDDISITTTPSSFSSFLPLQGFTSPVTSHVDFMDDTSSPVNSDPMLTSAPVSPYDDSTM